MNLDRSMEMSRTSSLVAIVAALSLAASAPAFSQEIERPEVIAARDYLQVMPVRAMIEDLAIQVTRTLPAEERESQRQLLLERVDFGALETAVVSSLTEHFTERELNALADFYGSEEGRSILEKMGEYMAEVMPLLQEQLLGVAGSESPPARD